MRIETVSFFASFREQGSDTMSPIRHITSEWFVVRQGLRGSTLAQAHYFAWKNSAAG
jgi:hypothetical protein